MNKNIVVSQFKLALETEDIQSLENIFRNLEKYNVEMRRNRIEEFASYATKLIPIDPKIINYDANNEKSITFEESINFYLKSFEEYIKVIYFTLQESFSTVNSFNLVPEDIAHSYLLWGFFEKIAEIFWHVNSDKISGSWCPAFSEKYFLNIFYSDN